MVFGREIIEKDHPSHEKWSLKKDGDSHVTCENHRLEIYYFILLLGSHVFVWIEFFTFAFDFCKIFKKSIFIRQE